MNDKDKAVIKENNFNESEAEDYIERMGMVVEDNGIHEDLASEVCAKWILEKRKIKTKEEV